MKKRKYLKRWLDYLIIFMQMILILLMAGEVDNLALFFISKLVFLGLFIINHLILVKYSKIIIFE